MFKGKKIAVIIAAAGSGTRMGGGISKQFRTIGSLPVLTRTVRAFDRHPLVDDIIVVTKEDSLELCRGEILAPYGFSKVRALLSGGDQRQDSVYRGLLALFADTDLVLIHDGARPFIGEKTISAAIERAAETGAAAVAVPVKDTIKRVEGDFFSHTPDRSTLYSVQTPQAFSVELIKAAMEQAFAEKFYGTDDSVLVERMGKKVYLVMGEPENIKLTTAEDMIIGAAIAADLDEKEDEEGCGKEEGRIAWTGEKETEMRVGTGFDVHRLEEGRKLILGGVEIPYEKGLLGHSDADVLLHAIMDALLGAASMGDIGRHFPDTGAEYKDISSLKLLAQVGDMLARKGYGIGNIDATVIAQQPKIAPYIPNMIGSIAETLSIPENRINIKGTTTEKLGYLGRGEGIAAQAAATLRYLKEAEVNSD